MYVYLTVKGGQANSRKSLVSQSKNVNRQICREKCSVSDPDPNCFASNIFYTCVRIFYTMECNITQNCSKSQKASLNLNEGNLS